MLVFLYFAFSFIANGFLKFFLILWKSFFLNNEINNEKLNKDIAHSSAKKKWQSIDFVYAEYKKWIQYDNYILSFD